MRQIDPVLLDLEKQFENYLIRAGLSDLEMPKGQLKEAKRAFFGGVALVFDLMTDEGIDPDDDMGIMSICAKLLIQVEAFWISEDIIKQQTARWLEKE